MNNIDFLHIKFLDIIDILLVAIFLYYVYKLLHGTAAIKILLGVFIIYIIYRVTLTLDLRMFSSILEALLGAGVVGLMIVFQQEIRKFLLMMGSAKFKNKSILRQINLFKDKQKSNTNINALVDVCFKLSKDKCGVLMVIERTSNLDFVLESGDTVNAEVNIPIIESIFYKNSPLHDGAIIIKNNIIKATRIVLPISSNPKIPKRFGLRHKAALGITEKTDAVCLIVSEETGEISFAMDGELSIFSNAEALKNKLKNNLK